MIDVFLRSNHRIEDVGAFIAKLDCSRVMVRDGGPTQIWERVAKTWQKSLPGMTLFEDLTAELIEFCPYRYSATDITDYPIDGEAALQFRLSPEDAATWLTLANKRQYVIEDGIGCSVDVPDGEGYRECACCDIAVRDFKDIADPATDLGDRLQKWCERAIAAGADQIVAFISTRK
ncbi:MAG: hypothetical protein KAX55_00430 [Propionivibrio sp.]|nr:hypothetical protein [Propionivibrio sp.]